jgi:orotate phosphoribosyltransferase
MKIINEKYAEELALKLLEIGAVILRPNEPFVWSSGWNSPIYCDNRLTLNHPLIREKIADHFVEHIRQNIPDVDVVTGTATAGIPHAAWVSDRLNKPMAYVRAKAKAYGMGNQIEGGVKKGQSTVIIEDLISTGTSVLSVVDALNFIGANVLQILTIFTYSFDVANKKLEDHNIEAFCLTDYPTLIRIAHDNEYINDADLKLLNEWRQNPDTWPKK